MLMELFRFFAMPLLFVSIVMFFFFNDPATTEIYTLSLHDALPICGGGRIDFLFFNAAARSSTGHTVTYDEGDADRKSTRLNSSHVEISYAVFCLKKKKKKNTFNNITTP